MLLIGTGGMAKEVISAMEVEGFPQDEIFTFNNLDDSEDVLLGKYPIYHHWEQVEDHFSRTNSEFVACIANPMKRLRLTEKALSLGGQLGQFISKFAVCRQDEPFGAGCIVEPGCIIPHSVIVHEGVFINAACTIGHDSILQRYTSFGPGCRILGNVEIGEFSYIGTNCVILPGVKIGKKVRIGIGKIITEDIPDNTKVE